MLEKNISHPQCPGAASCRRKGLLPTQAGDGGGDTAGGTGHYPTKVVAKRLRNCRPLPNEEGSGKKVEKLQGLRRGSEWVNRLWLVRAKRVASERSSEVR